MKVIVAGAFRPRLERIYDPFAALQDDDSPSPQPEDESFGYHHPVPSGRSILSAKTQPGIAEKFAFLQILHQPLDPRRIGDRGAPSTGSRV